MCMVTERSEKSIFVVFLIACMASTKRLDLAKIFVVMNRSIQASTDFPVFTQLF